MQSNTMFTTDAPATDWRMMTDKDIKTFTFWDGGQAFLQNTETLTSSVEILIISE